MIQGLFISNLIIILQISLICALQLVSVEGEKEERLERFSLECRKVIGFAITTLRDWLKRFAPLFHPIRSTFVKPKPIVTRSHAFSRALLQLPVITSSFDWSTVLSVFFVIS